MIAPITTTDAIRGSAFERLPSVSDAVAANVILRSVARGFEVRFEPLAQLRLRNGAHQAVHFGAVAEQHQ